MNPKDFAKVTGVFKRGVVLPMALMAGGAALAALSA
jgi:hypothetical protein